MQEREAIDAVRTGLGIRRVENADFATRNGDLRGTLFSSIDHARHGDPPGEPLEVWAYRAVGAAISDLACAGVVGPEVQIDLQVPAMAGYEEVYSVGIGVRRALDVYQAVLLNGNNTTINRFGNFGLSTVVHGARASGETPPPGRGGANPGDVLGFTGSVGAYNKALRLLNEGVRATACISDALLGGTAGLAVGRRLVGSGLLSSIIDLNDCLLLGAAEIARESGRGIVIEHGLLEEIAAEDDVDVDDLICPPSGDLSLLFSVAERDWIVVQRLASSEGVPVRRLGRVHESDVAVAISTWTKEEVASVAARFWEPSEMYKYPVDEVLSRFARLG